MEEEEAEENEAKSRQNETRLLAWCSSIHSFLPSNAIRFAFFSRLIGASFKVCVCLCVWFYCSHFACVVLDRVVYNWCD